MTSFLSVISSYMEYEIDLKELFLMASLSYNKTILFYTADVSSFGI